MEIGYICSFLCVSNNSLYKALLLFFRRMGPARGLLSAVHGTLMEKLLLLYIFEVVRAYVNLEAFSLCCLYPILFESIVGSSYIY